MFRRATVTVFRLDTVDLTLAWKSYPALSLFRGFRCSACPDDNEAVQSTTATLGINSTHSVANVANTVGLCRPHSVSFQQEAFIGLFIRIALGISH